ncbi:MAG: hypothetical protein QG599_2173 [Pseudomonadota bacterium]|nr:hypothetical protein [Pseudomonadota bacterium]
MFAIVKKPTYSWTVEVQTPDPAKPGKWKAHTFIGHFKKLADQAFRDALERLTDQQLDPAERYQRENEFIENVLIGWDGLTDEDGTPLPFNAETLAAVLDITEVRAGLFDAAFSSRRKASAKN